MPSARYKFKQRRWFRNSKTIARFANLTEFPRKNETAILLFFVGSHNEKEPPGTQMGLDREIEEYNDVVVGDFEEKPWGSMVMKHLSIMNWENLRTISDP